MVDFQCYGDVTSMLIKHLACSELSAARLDTVSTAPGTDRVQARTELWCLGIEKRRPGKSQKKQGEINFQPCVRSMSILRRIFGQKSTALPSEQAVLVHLDGRGLPEHIYEEYDLATIEDRLIEVIERKRLGEFDGNEIGPDEATLFMYGPDAERLFAGIESILREYPLCQGARVEIRRGAPGGPLREVRL